MTRSRSYTLPTLCLLTAVAFAGCGQGVDEGLDEPVDSDVPAPPLAVSGSASDAPVANATVTVAPCAEKVTDTLDRHVAMQRATARPYLFFFREYRSSDSSAELLGYDGNKLVTLYLANGGGYTTHADQCQVAAEFCGNGVKDSNEYCDGADFGGQDCASLGFTAGGSVRCSADCLIYVTGCKSTCGNGVREPDEECDGQVYQGCPDAGAVKCIGCKYDYSDCHASTCGDGVVDGREVCDPRVPLTPEQKDCSTLGAQSPHLPPGARKCSADCRSLDASGCNLACGDGFLDPNEPCDGTRFPAGTDRRCSSYGAGTTWPFGTSVNFLSGTITCLSYCQLNFQQCKRPPGCYLNGVFAPYCTWG